MTAFNDYDETCWVTRVLARTRPAGRLDFKTWGMSFGAAALGVLVASATPAAIDLANGADGLFFVGMANTASMANSMGVDVTQAVGQFLDGIGEAAASCLDGTQAVAKEFAATTMTHVNSVAATFKPRDAGDAVTKTIMVVAGLKAFMEGLEIARGILRRACSARHRHEAGTAPAADMPAPASSLPAIPEGAQVVHHVHHHVILSAGAPDARVLPGGVLVEAARSAQAINPAMEIEGRAEPVPCACSYGDIDLEGPQA